MLNIVDLIEEFADATRDKAQTERLGGVFAVLSPPLACTDFDRHVEFVLGMRSQPPDAHFKRGDVI